MFLKANDSPGIALKWVERAISNWRWLEVDPQDPKRLECILDACVCVYVEVCVCTCMYDDGYWLVILVVRWFLCVCLHEYCSGCLMIWLGTVSVKFQWNFTFLSGLRSSLGSVSVKFQWNFTFLSRLRSSLCMGGGRLRRLGLSESNKFPYTRGWVCHGFALIVGCICEWSWPNRMDSMRPTLSVHAVNANRFWLLLRYNFNVSTSHILANRDQVFILSGIRFILSRIR